MPQNFDRMLDIQRAAVTCTFVTCVSSVPAPSTSTDQAASWLDHDTSMAAIVVRPSIPPFACFPHPNLSKWLRHRRHAKTVLRSADLLAVAHYEKTKPGLGKWLPPSSTSSSELFPEQGDFARHWRPEAFWVRPHIPSGYPLIAARTREDAVSWVETLSA
jgi:hypothetical protein